MKLTKANYNKEIAFRTLKEAIENTEFEKEELSNETYVSLGIGKDSEGNLWFAVGSENDFTNCYFSDLENWQNWFEDDWIEEV